MAYHHRPTREDQITTLMVEIEQTIAQCEAEQGPYDEEEVAHDVITSMLVGVDPLVADEIRRIML